MAKEHHIASLMLQLRPECEPAVREQLSRIAGTEIHAFDASGKMIVSVEADETNTIQDVVSRLAAVTGVLTCNLVYHHCEDPETLAEEIEYENHQT